MPTPRDGESRDAFMERCIPQVMGEGKEQDQAIAICSSLYQKGLIKKLDEMTSRGDGDAAK